MASTPNNPNNPESKPKSTFSDLVDRIKSTVVKILPSDTSMDNIKKSVKSHAETMSSTLTENFKKVDSLSKISDQFDKMKESVMTSVHKTTETKDQQDKKNDLDDKKNKPN